MTWKELALEYRREIEQLWDDIDKSAFELERGVPKSFKRGLNMLEISLDLSQENVRILSYGEPLDNPVQPTALAAKTIETERKDDEDNFKWLRSTKPKRSSTVGESK